MWVQSLGREGPPEECMVTHSIILAWRIPWTEELGVMQSWTRLKQPSTHVTFEYHQLSTCIFGGKFYMDSSY